MFVTRSGRRWSRRDAWETVAAIGRPAGVAQLHRTPSGTRQPRSCLTPALRWIACRQSSVTPRLQRRWGTRGLGIGWTSPRCTTWRGPDSRPKGSTGVQQAQVFGDHQRALRHRQVLSCVREDPRRPLHGGRRTAACRRLWTTSTPVDNRYGPHPSRTALMWDTSGRLTRSLYADEGSGRLTVYIGRTATGPDPGTREHTMLFMRGAVACSSHRRDHHGGGGCLDHAQPGRSALGQTPLGKIDHLAVQQWVTGLGGRRSPGNCRRVPPAHLGGSSDGRLRSDHRCPPIYG